jgi:hypothetical protein
MNINEVLQGLSNLGGEMPRVTNPKRIKEIKPGRKNKNVKAKKGPMNIDLSKLGEASPMGYDDPATAKQPPIEPTISNAKAKQATTRAASRSNEFNFQGFWTWAHTTYPNLTGAQYKSRQNQLIAAYSKAQAQAQNEGLEEGAVGKAAATLAIAASLYGLASLAPSAKDTPLGKELAVAAQSGDQIAAYHYKNLDLYMDANDQRTLVNLRIKYIDDSPRQDVHDRLAKQAGIKNEAY